MKFIKRCFSTDNPELKKLGFGKMALARYDKQKASQYFQALLEEIDVNQLKKSDQDFVISTLIYADNPYVTEPLKKLPNDFSMFKKKYSSLILAAKYKAYNVTEEMVKNKSFLKEQSKTVDTDNHTPFHHAILSHNKAFFEIIATRSKGIKVPAQKELKLFAKINQVDDNKDLMGSINLLFNCIDLPGDLKLVLDPLGGVTVYEEV